MTPHHEVINNDPPIGDCSRVSRLLFFVLFADTIKNFRGIHRQLYKLHHLVHDKNNKRLNDWLPLFVLQAKAKEGDDFNHDPWRRGFDTTSAVRRCCCHGAAVQAALFLPL
ncbi:Uncharacterised protein [Actinobacillus pleuropneumoniae]|nr:Uncharacterised protein [Actinobacillus pleuropneumoniae]